MRLQRQLIFITKFQFFSTKQIYHCLSLILIIFEIQKNFFIKIPDIEKSTSSRLYVYLIPGISEESFYMTNG